MYKLNTKPNAVNVIPSEVDLTIEICAEKDSKKMS